MHERIKFECNSLTHRATLPTIKIYRLDVLQMLPTYNWGKGGVTEMDTLLNEGRETFF